ncbi:retrovirus-related pol polyprotein from transposon TNT 1-94 [Tanacetum coccineum]
MEAVEVPQTLDYRGGQLNAAPVLEDFQDSPDDEEDTRSSHEYLNVLEEEYQAIALLAKSKRLFKKGTQRFSSAKATNQTECHKCGKKGHFPRDCWSKTLVPSYQSPFQSKFLSSSQHKLELRPTKEFKAKYNKVKAILALLSSSASASKASTVKNKGSSTHTQLITDDIEWVQKGEATFKPKSGCSRHMTGVKSYLHKYVEQLGPKVVFGDDFTCTTEGYGSIKFYIHNHNDHLGKFDEKADDGYLLGYSLISKAFGVFNTRRQQTEETYHITFDESLDAIKFSKPSVDNINIAKNERYPPDEYLHPYEPSQRYQTNSNDVSFIEPYESPKLVVLETKVSSDQMISEHLSSLNVEDTSVQDTISILNPPLPIASVVTPAPQDR